jgi:hypothetical protein
MVSCRSAPGNRRCSLLRFNDLRSRLQQEFLVGRWHQNYSRRVCCGTGFLASVDFAPFSFRVNLNQHRQECLCHN